ncbi:TadE family protein [Microbacterium sp. W1N]|uniref:TadE/TadG family type IV pilus assembly protein n=1 Tax=Microbacterium festucae TaxID=2977531 RepID=UPI0021C1E033|nr:TadE family protein [Microbacterium festucae]MCT9820396.1 TadE family protein [Microbacterium festucae]
MRRPRASTDRAAPADAETGSAAIEFIFAGLVLLVPIVYLIVALGTIQGQAMGTQAAARQLARTIATAPDPGDADGRAERVVAAIADEYGMAPADLRVRIGCAPAGAACPSAGATLRVTVSTRVALPLVPPVLGLDDLVAVPVEASAVQKVSRYPVSP